MKHETPVYKTSSGDWTAL